MIYLSIRLPELIFYVKIQWIMQYFNHLNDKCDSNTSEIDKNINLTEICIIYQLIIF